MLKSKVKTCRAGVAKSSIVNKLLGDTGGTNAANSLDQNVDGISGASTNYKNAAQGLKGSEASAAAAGSASEAVRKICEAAKLSITQAKLALSTKDCDEKQKLSLTAQYDQMLGELASSSGMSVGNTMQAMQMMQGFGGLGQQFSSAGKNVKNSVDSSGVPTGSVGLDQGSLGLANGGDAESTTDDSVGSGFGPLGSDGSSEDSSGLNTGASDDLNSEGDYSGSDDQDLSTLAEDLNSCGGSESYKQSSCVESFSERCTGYLMATNCRAFSEYHCRGSGAESDYCHDYQVASHCSSETHKSEPNCRLYYTANEINPDSVCSSDYSSKDCEEVMDSRSDSQIFPQLKQRCRYGAGGASVCKLFSARYPQLNLQENGSDQSLATSGAGGGSRPNVGVNSVGAFDPDKINQPSYQGGLHGVYEGEYVIGLSNATPGRSLASYVGEGESTYASDVSPSTARPNIDVISSANSIIRREGGIINY